MRMPSTVTNRATTSLCTRVHGIVECVDKGFILQAVERTHAGRTEVHLVGRMETGETFAVVDRRRMPFFYVRASDETPARGICERERPAPDIIASDRRTMDGSPVLRLESPTTSA